MSVSRDTPPCTRRGARALLRIRDIHDSVAQRVEVFGVQWFREEVGDVLSGGHVRDDDELLLNELANVKVAALDVLNPLMMLGVIGQVARARVVGGELEWSV
eukprot:2578081-Prymnesium_polylepis.2